jgi:hypothetical protein
MLDPPADATTLPRLEADSLSGTHVVLPTDAAGKPLILLLAFTPESQDDVTAWSRKLLADHVQDHAAVYVVAVADRTAHFMRKRIQKIVSGSAVGSKDQQRSNVLITFDGTGWRDLVPPGDKKAAGIVVCDASGAIVYAKRDPLTAANAADVEQAAK